MKFLTFREKMETECRMGVRKLPTKALRLDGAAGIRSTFIGDGLKSCDYLKSNKRFVCFIEFSDLSAQLTMLKKDLGTALGDNFKHRSYKITRSLEPMNIIRSELRDKFIHTDLLFHKLNISKKLGLPRKYIIGICCENKSDVRIFDHLMHDLSSSLKGLASKVEIVPAEEVSNCL